MEIITIVRRDLNKIPKLINLLSEAPIEKKSTVLKFNSKIMLTVGKYTD